MLFQEEDIIKKIEGVVNSLKPGFELSGGEVNFVKYEHGVAYIHFEGYYIGYQSDLKATFEMIEREFRMSVPEVERVELL